MSDDLHNEELQDDLDSQYRGLRLLNLTDETELSILEGAAEELSMPDYESLKPLSAECIIKMYKVVLAICGTVGAPLTRRYREVTQPSRKVLNHVWVHPEVHER